MKSDDYGRAGLLAATVGLAVLCYMAACGTASAAPHELRFRNPDQTRAYASIRTPWGIVAAPCAPGATCSVIIDAPIGNQTITAEATADGATWSSTSNALAALILPAPADCLALPACRFDADLSGSVTVADFGQFFRALGSSWLPAP